MIKINKIQTAEVTSLLPLFNDYLKFYRVESNSSVEGYLKDRIQNNESVVFVAKEGDKFVGFVQLYFTYSSLMQGRVVVLNDLYILPEFRRKNIAGMLIDNTLAYAKEINAKNVTLSTQIPNSNAQELYKKKGFRKDNDFFHFNFKL